MGYYLKEKSKNHYRFEGEHSFFVRKSKSVIIDGETYRKDWNEDCIFSAEDLYSKGEDVFEINFNEIGVEIKLDIEKRAHNFLKGFPYKLSSNENVAYYNLLEIQSNKIYFKNEKHLKIDNRIKNIYNSKTRCDGIYFSRDLCDSDREDGYWYKRALKQTPFLREMLEDGTVTFKLFDYGFNNSIYYIISAADYVMLPYENIKGKGLEVLQKLGWYGKKKNELKDAMRIFEEKIKQLDKC